MLADLRTATSSSPRPWTSSRPDIAPCGCGLLRPYLWWLIEGRRSGGGTNVVSAANGVGDLGRRCGADPPDDQRRAGVAAQVMAQAAARSSEPAVRRRSAHCALLRLRPQDSGL